MKIAGAMLTVWWLGTALAAYAQSPPPSGDGKDDPSQLVVVVTGQLGGLERMGAGIVVGEAADRVYIATANHNVRHGEQAAGSLKVRFKTLPGETFEAKLLADFDKTLDLAVLSVADVKQHGLTFPTLTLARLGDPSVLKRGDDVYALGHPGGRRWRVSVAADRFARRTTDWLYFESTALAPGHSGGALLNERREIVGMLRGDQPPDGEALSIARVIESLRDWGYPVSLGQKPAVNFTGTWHGTVDYARDGTVYREAFKFDVEGDKVVGIGSLYKRNVHRLKDGKVTNDVISFAIVTESEDYVYRGKISGDRIEFTVREEGKGRSVYWKTHRMVVTRATAPTPPAVLSVPRRQCKEGRRELGRLDIFHEHFREAAAFVLCAAPDGLSILKSLVGGPGDHDYREAELKGFAGDLVNRGLRCGEVSTDDRSKREVKAKHNYSSVLLLCQENGTLVSVGVRVETTRAGGVPGDEKLVVKWPN